MSIDEVKTYLRVDNDADNALIQTLIDSSADYLRSAVDDYDNKVAKCEEKPDKGREWLSKAHMARLLLISDWYENRLAKERPVTAAVSLLIVQLQVDPVKE